MCELRKAAFQASGRRCTLSFDLQANRFLYAMVPQGVVPAIDFMRKELPADRALVVHDHAIVCGGVRVLRADVRFAIDRAEEFLAALLAQVHKASCEGG